MKIHPLRYTSNFVFLYFKGCNFRIFQFLKIHPLKYTSQCTATGVFWKYTRWCTFWLYRRQNHKSIAAIVDVVYYGCKTKCKHRSYILLKKIIQIFWQMFYLYYFHKYSFIIFPSSIVLFLLFNWCFYWLQGDNANNQGTFFVNNANSLAIMVSKN